MRSLSPIKESEEEPSGVKACDEIPRMLTGANVTENLICVEWLSFEGAGAFFRLNYKVRTVIC